MTTMAVVLELANLLRVCPRQREHGLESLPPELRLIAEHNGPLRQIDFPAGPLRGALNRAEHASIRREIEDAVLHGEIKLIEFGLNGPVTFGAKHRDLFRA